MIMKSIFVKEQYPYSKADLIRIFGKDDANTCIKKLKEFGVLKTIKKEKRFSDLSELNDVDLVIVDEEDTEIERYYVFGFVGVIIVNGYVLKCYPKYIFSTQEPFDELMKVISVLEKYNNSKEQIIKICINSQSDKEFNRLAAIMYLLNDYYENGVYNNTQDIIEVNGNGEINWNKTINETFAILHNNRPYYVELQTLMHKNNDRDYFKRLHECLLGICSAELKELSLLELLGLTEVDLTDETLDDFGDKSYILSQLEKEINIQFNTRKQSLLKVMYMFIANEGTLADKSNFSLYGTNAFHAIWEEACAVAMGNILHKKLRDIKVPSGVLSEYYRKRANYELIDIIEKPTWFDAQGYDHKAKETLIPDIVSIHEDAFYIFDAKYYNIRLEVGKDVDGQPGIGDITKQYLYQLAYKRFCKDHGFVMKKVRNSFLMPTEKGDCPVKIGSVRLDMLSSLKLKNVRVVLLPANMVYDAYLMNQTIEYWNLKL